MGNTIIRGRNSKDNLFQYSSNSTSTNSFNYENIIQSPNKINLKQNFYRKYKYNSESKALKYHSRNNNLINFSKINGKNNINSGKNKIIDLSLETLNRRKHKYNNYNMKLSQGMKTRNKNININKKQKIIGLYTEYDSKFNNKNIRIQEKFIFKNQGNNIKRIDIKFFKTTENVNRFKNILNKEERDSNINNKTSLESSRFINYNIIKEKTSDLTFKSTLNITNRNQLKNQIYNQFELNNEVEFEEYIAHLNSEDFNIDKELIERPLFNLMKQYQFHSNLNKQKKLCQKSEGDETQKSILYENNLANNKKNKIKIHSLIHIFNSKKMKKHKIFLDKINKRYNFDKKNKIISNTDDKHKFDILIKNEYNHKTELSTSANSKYSKSKGLNFYSS